MDRCVALLDRVRNPPHLAGGPRAPAPRASSAGPQYDEKGNLKRPTDYRTWVFVGANLGLQYRKDLLPTTLCEMNRHKESRFGDFQNVYLRPESYGQYLK